MTFGNILPYIQIILSVALIVAVLLQQTGAALGGAFGADNFSAAYHTRRGMEKYLFYTTSVVGLMLALTSLVAFLVH